MKEETKKILAALEDAARAIRHAQELVLNEHNTSANLARRDAEPTQENIDKVVHDLFTQCANSHDIDMGDLCAEEKKAWIVGAAECFLRAQNEVTDLNHAKRIIFDGRGDPFLNLAICDAMEYTGVLNHAKQYGTTEGYGVVHKSAKA